MAWSTKERAQKALEYAIPLNMCTAAFNTP